FAPVAGMLAHGIAVGIGTDGCASNNDLDMWEEMRLTSLLAKGVTGSPLAVPAIQAVAMATIDGARALHLDHLIGSLEPGKRADLIVVRLDDTSAIPRFETTGQNIYSHLVYSGKACAVRDVFVNGRQVLRDGQLLTVDEAEVREQAWAMARRINRFFIEREKSVLDKLVDIGGLEQQETFEVQAKGLLHDVQTFERGLAHAEIHITQHTSRDQYDTYFLFADPSQGRLRYREDHIIQAGGTVQPVY
ncbi:MAG: amidohydrolase family protein, partial [Chloroflexi bacterium]|nr:amidohydrolase family protein [Chloroflexota bacterium]